MRARETSLTAAEVARCGSRHCVTLTMMVVNVVLLLVGVAGFGYSIHLAGQELKGKQQNATAGENPEGPPGVPAKQQSFTIPIFPASVGTMGTLVALLCVIMLTCGRKNSCCQKLYAVLMSLIVLTQLAVGIVFLIPDTKQQLTTRLEMTDAELAFIDTHLQIIGIGLLSVAGLELVGVVCASCLCCCLNKPDAAANSTASGQGYYAREDGGGGGGGRTSSAVSPGGEGALGARHRSTNEAWAKAQHKNDKVRAGCCNRTNGRFLLVLCIFVSVISGGAGVFQAIEAKAQLADKSSLTSLLLRLEQRMANSTDPAERTDLDLLKDRLGDPRDIEKQFNSFTRMWILAFTLVTSIGYGIISPVTDGGQIFCVFYSLLGIPVTAYTLAFMAERLLHLATWLFTPASRRLRAAFDSYDHEQNGVLSGPEIHEALQDLGYGHINEKQYAKFMSRFDISHDEELDFAEFEAACTALHADFAGRATKAFKLRVCGGLILVWLLAGSVLFWLTEKDAQGWGFVQGLYFTVITISTIGLGDYFPTLYTFQYYFLVPYCLVGLGLIAVFYSLAQQYFDMTSHWITDIGGHYNNSDDLDDLLDEDGGGDDDDDELSKPLLNGSVKSAGGTFGAIAVF
eukprot:g2331.t1